METGGCVSLARRGDGDGRMRILGEAEATNQVSVQLGQMCIAIRIAERNIGQFWNQIPSPEPLFNGGLMFTLQDGRHARYLLLFHHMCSRWHASLSRHAHALSAGSHEAIQKASQNVRTTGRWRLFLHQPSQGFLAAAENRQFAARKTFHLFVKLARKALGPY